MLTRDRASWNSARIIQRQVSPESDSIFDLILELCRATGNDWTRLREDNEAATLESVHLEKFGIYAALVLFNQGNYYGYGDRKFVPGVPAEFLQKITSNASTKARALLEEIVESMLSPNPGNLGYPSSKAQSSYYLGSGRVSEEEIQDVDVFLRGKDIYLENTRLYKQDAKSIRVLQASTRRDAPRDIGYTASGIRQP